MFALTFIKSKHDKVGLAAGIQTGTQLCNNPSHSSAILMEQSWPELQMSELIKLNHYRLKAGRFKTSGGLNRRLKDYAPKGGGFYRLSPSAAKAA